MALMTRELKASYAFVERNFNLSKRYWGWEVAWLVYSVAGALAVSLIGRSEGNERLLLTLVIGAIFWSYLSIVFEFIAEAVQWERWEGTLEYTFMAPVSRMTHLAGVSLFTLAYSVVRTIIIVAGLSLIIDLDLAQANFAGLFVVLMVSSMAFVGLGLMAAVLPVMSPERGAEATNIFQGILLLVSGVYYPVEVLPGWLQPLAAISPATYALRASRKLLGIEGAGEGPQAGAPLSEVVPELLVLALMGAAMIPLGLYVFGLVESWAKRTGKLKRTG
jgi:ABC-2 type transport system permease protein